MNICFSVIQRVGWGFSLLCLSFSAWCHSDTKNITNKVLTKRVTNCAEYVGNYSSKVTDLGRELSFVGQVKITANKDTCVLSVNQIPNHDFGGKDVRWPREVKSISEKISIPRNPEIAKSPTSLGLTPAIILLNGVKWEANPAACFGEGKGKIGRERIGCGPRFDDHPWRYNVGSKLNEFRFDEYHAHVQGGGMYHYHATPRVLYSNDANIYGDKECAVAGPSPVIGFALDGFPVYGPCILDEKGITRAARSSYQLKNGERKTIKGYETPYIVGLVKSSTYNGQFNGDFEYVDKLGDLDACNGLFRDGHYGYYVTQGYPYATHCFAGVPHELK